MIALTKVTNTNTEIFAFIAVPVFKPYSFVYKQKRQ